MMDFRAEFERIKRETEALWARASMQPAIYGFVTVHRSLNRMTMRAAGTFEVKLGPLEGYEPTLGRMSIDKRFSGDLQGTSRGEMLSMRSAVQGSAGYVALERVTGTLHGRGGTFVLQHFGVMDRGAPSLTVSVVPDSGTGDLEGLAGTMNIIIAGGTHSYQFDYTLGEDA